MSGASPPPDAGIISGSRGHPVWIPERRELGNLKKITINYKKTLEIKNTYCYTAFL